MHLAIARSHGGIGLAKLEQWKKNRWIEMNGSIQINAQNQIPQSPRQSHSLDQNINESNDSSQTKKLFAEAISHFQKYEKIFSSLLFFVFFSIALVAL